MPRTRHIFARKLNWSKSSSTFVNMYNDIKGTIIPDVYEHAFLYVKQ